MNANKYSVYGIKVAALVLLGAFSSSTWAQLDSSSQTKVDSALAKQWSKSKGNDNPTSKEKVVNIGSKKNGCSNVNIGTVKPSKPGERAPKEIVVTTKEVINVCK